MTEFERLIAECKLLPKELCGAGEAIAYYSASISTYNWKQNSNGRWLPVGDNFITMKPQWKRAGSIAVTLRGNPPEFEMYEFLKLKKDQNGYSAFQMTEAVQISDAFAYIRRARQLFERGRTRVQTQQVTIG